MLGVLFGGTVVRKLKPGVSTVYAYIVVVDVMLLACLASSLFLGCEALSVNGVLKHNGEYVGEFTRKRKQYQESGSVFENYISPSHN